MRAEGLHPRAWKATGDAVLGRGRHAGKVAAYCRGRRSHHVQVVAARTRQGSEVVCEEYRGSELEAAHRRIADLEGALRLLIDTETDRHACTSERRLRYNLAADVLAGYIPKPDGLRTAVKQ